MRGLASHLSSGEPLPPKPSPPLSGAVAWSSCDKAKEGEPGALRSDVGSQSSWGPWCEAGSLTTRRPAEIPLFNTSFFKNNFLIFRLQLTYTVIVASGARQSDSTFI